MTIHESFLTVLLPTSPFILAYAIPMLLLSLLLTLAGAFLTLDRTRSFPVERYGVLPGAFEQRKRIHFLLEGGVGGLAAGYAFGVHLSTFLSLLVPAISSSSSLSPRSFVPIWLLSGLITTFLAGRWRYCALTFIGLSGGAAFSLGVSVVIHPSLLARIIITAIFVPTSTLFVLLPIPKIQRSAVRFGASVTGAFGVVLSIALLANIPSWANVWDRLWEAQDETGTWGTTKEKGLSAGFFLFLTAGIVCDFFLRRTFGECPDEKWDSYLATYASNLPNAADRAGTFVPVKSFWDRVLGSSPATKPPRDIVFPDDDADDVKLTPGKGSESFEFQQSPAFLKKGRSVGHTRFKARMSSKKRDGVKFKPVGDSYSDDDDDDPLNSPPLSPTSKVPRPWLRQKTSIASTTPTLVDDLSPKGGKLDFDREVKKVREGKKLRDGEAPEYSDFEDDVTNMGGKHSGEEWKPGFLKRHTSGANSTSSTSQQTIVKSKSPPLGAVPATPSLIKALDRIAVAQKDAFSQPPSPEEKGARWDEFWKDVRDKAR
ncbi:hypothetical protein MIND_00604200 [Mycena indigotica]|uniref:DUF4203 domain-containing protein n=1 Tax=Mycena indigotica TaxID=2126181 RepID=A0A8H6SS80_9AGAR|nr:uncharacterized protein MIND_00604200 [Mycena indigotica]KAF7303746.1 hypothetical protein MIND_00604200 [Mycena indigotica]